MNEAVTAITREERGEGTHGVRLRREPGGGPWVGSNAQLKYLFFSLQSPCSMFFSGAHRPVERSRSPRPKRATKGTAYCHP